MIIQITCADREPFQLVDNRLATSLALSGGQVRFVHQGADFFSVRSALFPALFRAVVIPLLSGSELLLTGKQVVDLVLPVQGPERQRQRL